MSEIKPTPQHLNDPYVLQLIEALAKQGDEIDSLQDILKKREATIKELSKEVHDLETRVAESEKGAQDE